MLLPGCYRAVGKLRDTALGVGKHSLSALHSQSWFWGVSGLARRPGLSGSQAVGYPGAAGSHRRAGNRVGAHRLDLAWRGGFSGWFRRKSLWLNCLRLEFGLVVAPAGNAEAFYGRLDGSSVGKGLLHGSPWWIPMKRGRLWF